jgi:hypothetical protein
MFLEVKQTSTLVMQESGCKDSNCESFYSGSNNTYNGNFDNDNDAPETFTLLVEELLVGTHMCL